MVQISLGKEKRLLPLFIFSFFFLIYLASSGAHGDPYDGLSYFLMTENFVLNGTPSININSPSADELGFDINEYIRTQSSVAAWSQWEFQRLQIAPDLTFEEYRSVYPFSEYRDAYVEKIDRENFLPSSNYLVLPILAAPLYAIATVLNLSTIHFVFLFLNSTIIATSAVVMFYLGKEIFKSERIGFVLSLIFGITSYIWPYTTSMFARPLGILFLMISIYLILHQKNRKGIVVPFLAGFSIALSSLSHPHFLMLLPAVFVFGIYEFRKDKRHLMMFVSAVLILLLILGYLNYTVRDSFFQYVGFVDYPQFEQIAKGNFLEMFEGVYGFLFSPGRSIFLYFPLALVFPFGMYYLYKKDKGLSILLISLILITYLYVATSYWWYWNPYWGPHRFLLPLIPLITISLGSLISKFSTAARWKWSIVSLSIVGFFVNLMGNLVWVQYAFSFAWGPEGLWKVEDKDLVFAWNPYFSPFIQTFKVLSADWVASLPTNPASMDYFRVGLNGCSYDVYLFCEYGIIPIILLGISIAVIAFLILRNLSILPAGWKLYDQKEL